MRENLAFTERAIAKLQCMEIGGTFADALHAYLVKVERVAWDDTRALFLVTPPNGVPQVALWLMPVATQFAPLIGEAQ